MFDYSQSVLEKLCTAVYRILCIGYIRQMDLDGVLQVYK